MSPVDPPFIPCRARAGRPFQALSGMDPPPPPGAVVFGQFVPLNHIPQVPPARFVGLPPRELRLAQMRNAALIRRVLEEAGVDDDVSDSDDDVEDEDLGIAAADVAAAVAEVDAAVADVFPALRLPNRPLAVGHRPPARARRRLVRVDEPEVLPQPAVRPPPIPENGVDAAGVRGRPRRRAAADADVVAVRQREGEAAQDDLPREEEI